MRIDQLPSFNYHVSAETLTSVVRAEFRRRPELPGALVLQDRQLAGVVPRRRAEEQFLRPFAEEAVGGRPLSTLLQVLGGRPLLLEGDVPLAKAADAVLARPVEYQYDPFVVRRPDGNVGLVAVRDLIAAMSAELSSSPPTAVAPPRNGAAAAAPVASINPNASPSPSPSGTPPSEAKPRDVVEDDSADLEGVVSRKVAFEQMDGDVEMVKQIGGMVLDMCPGWIDDMQQALDKQDAGGLRLLAHSLKSSADKFGGEATVQAAFALERVAADEDLEKAAPALESLRAEFDRFLPALRRLLADLD